MTTPTLTNVLIGQWQQSPRLSGIVNILQNILDDGIGAKERIQLFLAIDNAEGVWLENLGALVGIDRPATTDPSLDERFGFDEAGEQFDEAPFRGFAGNDAVYPLPDVTYRRFVKARAIMVLGDGSIYTFTNAVKEIDPNATVVDNRNMTITITTVLAQLVQLADSIGSLPRTAGVQIIYV